MRKLDLTIHEGKTKLVNLGDGKQGFDFLGFQHRWNQKRSKAGKTYYVFAQIPGTKAMKKMRQSVRELLGNRARHERTHRGIKPKDSRLEKLLWADICKD